MEPTGGKQGSRETAERRSFLRWIGGGLLGLLALFFGSMVTERRHRLRSEQQPVRVPLNLPQGVTFHEKVIIYREGDRYETLSGRCSHLGCIVDRKQGEKLICPCHGSMYSFEGKLLNGPATRNLVRLRYRIDKKEKQLIIEPPA
ncbi:MAG: Rieske (2Fe-2S) protein [Deltaproteobacteria bacterium]